MVRWLSKAQDPESENRERVNAYCLGSIKMVGLLHVRRREKRDRKIVEVVVSKLFDTKSTPQGHILILTRPKGMNKYGLCCICSMLDNNNP